jgi:hypothetical protein
MVPLISVIVAVCLQAIVPQPPVEKLGPGRFRVGSIRVDTNERQMSVPARINQVAVLEFLANTRGGMKAYESALTLDTDAISFNLALVLIGLDRANARLPAMPFDPAEVKGDPVEIWLEVPRGDRRERLEIERLLYDQKTKRTVPKGRWVYTGSTFVESGQYLAQLEGVLIGFMHSPAAVIEHAAGIGLGEYGSIVLNPELEIPPGAPLMLTIRAAGAPNGALPK